MCTLTVRFVANQVLPGMRDQFSPEQRAELRALVKEAATFSQAMQSENRRAMRLIWELWKPFRAQIVVGTLMIFVAETAAAVWWATMMQLPYIANAPGTRTEVMALAFRSCLSNFTVWAFQHQCSVAGNAIVGHAEANFVMRLRNATMRAILSQDREFHDIHTVGVLQERINHTCRVSGRSNVVIDL